MAFFRPAASLFLQMLLYANAWSADVVPEFTAEGVVRGDRTAQILVPGAHMSIYGRHLSSFGSGCVGSPDPQHRETPNPRRPYEVFVDTSVYPKELCETQ